MNLSFTRHVRLFWRRKNINHFYMHSHRDLKIILYRKFLIETEPALLQNARKYLVILDTWHYYFIFVSDSSRSTLIIKYFRIWPRSTHCHWDGITNYDENPTAKVRNMTRTRAVTLAMRSCQGLPSPPISIYKKWGITSIDMAL